MNARNCNCSNSTNTKPYSIEKPASDRPLEAYAVGRIYQLEAQVEDQKNYIVQLKDTLDRCASDYRKLLEILKPSVSVTFDGGTRKIDVAGATIKYCRYSRDQYYKLVALFGLQKENHQACMQEYESEILDGTDTDLSDDERIAAKADYEAKAKKEGDDSNAD